MIAGLVGHPPQYLGIPDLYVFADADNLIAPRHLFHPPSGVLEPSRMLL